MDEQKEQKLPESTSKRLRLVTYAQQMVSTQKAMEHFWLSSDTRPRLKPYTAKLFTDFFAESKIVTHDIHFLLRNPSMVDEDILKDVFEDVSHMTRCAMNITEDIRKNYTGHRSED